MLKDVRPLIPDMPKKCKIFAQTRSPSLERVMSSDLDTYHVCVSTFDFCSLLDATEPLHAINTTDSTKL